MSLVDEDGYDLWLRYRPVPTQLSAAAHIAVDGACPSSDLIVEEWSRAASAMFGVTPERITGPLDRAADSVVVGSRAVVAEFGFDPHDHIDLCDADHGHHIAAVAGSIVVIAETPAARVRGLFDLIRRLQLGNTLDELPGTSVPVIEHRILAHWDNLDGSIERGYAGQTLWQWDDLPEVVDARYRDYARACASIGLNGSCLNNVNSVGEVMSDRFLAKAAVIADELRPYGIRTWLAPSWASPMTEGGLPTADPADPAVRAYWEDRAARIYELIPDFAGFQIKADSEGQPGPFQYDADHATGANLLASVLEPHGGMVLWRAFVYDTARDPDRAKSAYLEYVPLDGRFASNVVLQAKNGPVDFQPREPHSPLFGGMQHTPVALELQVAQEYLGHSTHLVYLGPMWTEIIDSETHSRSGGATVGDVVRTRLGDPGHTVIIAVANTGEDRNWCGHHFAQANWYAYGRLAWDPTLSAEDIAAEWIRLTWSDDPEVAAVIAEIMAMSWPACVDYMVPLGLHHLSQDSVHYGPEPDLDTAPRLDWTNTYFHKADDVGVGFDRSSTGSNATAQYHEPLRSQFDDIETCPDDLLLWFHHVPWDHEMSSGRSLIDELEFRYERGASAVVAMSESWQRLAGRVDEQRHREVAAKLAQHVVDSRDWATTCATYFRRIADGAERSGA